MREIIGLFEQFVRPSIFHLFKINRGKFCVIRKLDYVYVDQPLAL